MSHSTSSRISAPVNVAVVGLGFMGVTHLHAYLNNPLARVVAVCDAVRLPLNGVLSGVAGNIRMADDIYLNPDVKVFRNLDELLAEPGIHLVDICTPTPLHPEQAIAALQSGKHVLCEKPLARSSLEAREILKAAANSPGWVMPAMCMRFWPGWSWLKQLVAEETFGKVLAAKFSRVSAMPAWSNQTTYKAEMDLGGALFDLHVHDTDFVNYLFGLPDSVFSSGVLGKGGAINHVVTQYHFADGPTVHAEGSWLRMQGFDMAYTLHCERVTLDFDLARGTDALRLTQPGKMPRTVPCDWPDGYNVEVNYIVDCVVNQRAPQIVTGTDGLMALEICEAEEKSIRLGKPVQILNATTSETHPPTLLKPETQCA